MYNAEIGSCAADPVGVLFCVRRRVIAVVVVARLLGLCFEVKHDKYILHTEVAISANSVRYNESV